LETSRLSRAQERNSPSLKFLTFAVLIAKASHLALLSCFSPLTDLPPPPPKNKEREELHKAVFFFLFFLSVDGIA
jgi:hypothetical protein